MKNRYIFIFCSLLIFSAYSTFVFFKSVNESSVDKERGLSSGTMGELLWTKDLLKRKQKNLAREIRSRVRSHTIGKKKEIKQSSPIRHYGVFNRSVKGLTDKWTASYRGKKISLKLTQLWINEIEKTKFSKSEISWGQLFIAGKKYWVASFVEVKKDERKKIYSALVKNDWLVSSLSRTLNGEHQVVVVDENNKVHFSDRVAEIGKKLSGDRLTKEVRQKAKVERSQFGVMVSKPNRIMSADTSKELFFWLSTLVAFLLFGLTAAFFARRQESHVRQVPLPAKKSIIEKEILESVSAPIKRDVLSQVKNRDSLYDSLVIALVALRAQKNTPAEKNLDIIEEQLRAIKSEIGRDSMEGQNAELDLDWALSEIEELPAQEEQETVVQKDIASIPEELPDSVSAAPSPEFDESVIIRRPRIKELN